MVAVNFGRSNCETEIPFVMLDFMHVPNKATLWLVVRILQI
jgi:hypothetical protein